MTPPVFALVDCNNFFVSCERLFRPDLEGKPVVVLSSNDGCAVARSNEAKALGIPMGAPAFKYRELFQRHGVIQFSANFELYGDLSRRITQLLTEITPRTEIYSIDEAFMDLSALNLSNYEAWGHHVRQRILREVGLPVSVGIATTKTLAKLGSERAKKDPASGGVLSLIGLPESALAARRQEVPLEDVWGVGRRLAPTLRTYGISTAEDLSHMRPQLARQLMGIRGAQLVAELSGTSCFPLESLHTKAKSIARTRTFGEDTHDLYVIESAIASFAVQATYRLRRSGQLTRRAGIFLTTSRHKPNYKSWTQELTFQLPTADSGRLARALVQALGQLHDPLYSYHRAGVWLYDFVPDNQVQPDLLGDIDLAAHSRSSVRMQTVDDINRHYGKGTVGFAAEKLAHAWQPKRNLRSPRYVSNWDELPEVKMKNPLSCRVRGVQ